MAILSTLPGIPIPVPMCQSDSNVMRSCLAIIDVPSRFAAGAVLGIPGFQEFHCLQRIQETGEIQLVSSAFDTVRAL
jgi:hypothetical protein